jgi:DNA polymerase-3 subunit alpha
MSGKFRGREEFEKAKNRFFQGCHIKGYDEGLSREVWRQIESFAGYAFAKGHSASYAVESYQSLFLKAYYPLEYMLATVNNGGGFYSIEHYLHEARMMGATVEPPCLNQSDSLCTLNGNTFYLGLSLIKQLETEFISDILMERAENGEFSSLQDLVSRVPCRLEQLRLLIRIGAFRFTKKGKKELMWEAHLLLAKSHQSLPSLELFTSQSRSFELPRLESAQLEDAYDEIELLGYPLCNPFNLYEFKERGVESKKLKEYKNRKVVCTGYLVTYKVTRTSKGESMFFGNFIDLNGDYLDTVHFPSTARRYPFRGAGVYTFSGRVTEEFDCYSIEVEQMHKVSIKPDPSYADVERKQPPHKIYQE